MQELDAVLGVMYGMRGDWLRRVTTNGLQRAIPGPDLRDEAGRSLSDVPRTGAPGRRVSDSTLASSGGRNPTCHGLVQQRLSWDGPASGCPGRDAQGNRF